MLKISLTQWQIFCAVIDLGGYAKAAKALNKSHSSLHHAVQKLQDQLGIQLIEVTGKQVALTDLGEVMHRRARLLVEEAETLEKLAPLLQQGWEPEITLAIDTIYPKQFLSKILGKFTQENPISRLQIKEVVLQGAADTIAEKKADLVISPLVPRGIIGVPLMTQLLKPYAHASHPLHELAGEFTSRQMEEFLQIVIRDNSRNQDRKTGGWLKSEQRWTVDSLSQARDIMKSGNGFCWAPPEMMAEDTDLKPLVGEQNLDRLVALYIVLPNGELSGPGVQLLSKLFQEAHLQESAS